MFKYFLILSLLISVQLNAQEELPPTESEKMADSILKTFSNPDTIDLDFPTEEDQEKLIAADEKHMDEFLMVDKERDQEIAKKFKTYLYILIGSVFVIATIVVLRNKRKRRVGGDNSSRSK